MIKMVGLTKSKGIWVRISEEAICGSGNGDLLMRMIMGRVEAFCLTCTLIGLRLLLSKVVVYSTASFCASILETLETSGTICSSLDVES
jgi:hypothetical protein